MAQATEKNECQFVNEKTHLYKPSKISLYREETGKFPDYPSDEEGGSAAVFHPELHADLEGSEAAKNSDEAPVSWIVFNFHYRWSALNDLNSSLEFCYGTGDVVSYHYANCIVSMASLPP